MASRPLPRTKYRLPVVNERALTEFILYETSTRFYFVGSDRLGMHYRVLKLDRTDPRELVIIEDPTDYTLRQVTDMLNMVKSGNRNCGGMSEVGKFYGILGFIRFLEGYYMVLISQRKVVGTLGQHEIYAITNSTLVYIPHPSVRVHHSDEARYTSIFAKMELVHDFFFSYTYDLTHSLQYNMSQHGQDRNGSRCLSGSCGRPPFAENFVWNHFLGKEFWQKVKCKEWALPIIHGYFAQSRFSLFGRVLSFTLIARRSKNFAGTRYLKRGVNCQGHVANEVETEQILHDTSTGSYDGGNFTAIVQLRGSVPLYWSQDISMMVPKPPISIRPDPLHTATALHFENLMERYGPGILAINLVKEHEKVPRESLLRNEFRNSVLYINQFLPPAIKITYLAWDMARASKMKSSSVMDGLASIARKVLKATGIFHSSYQPHVITDKYLQRRQPELGGIGYQAGGIGRQQVGVARVNCIDSLDRTNAAQFCIGKCALGHQMYAMGLVESPTKVDFDCLMLNVITEMYEEMGDHIALQYGGSQLNHTMDTYRNSTWSAYSRDMVTAIRRYYSNSFTDAEKQEAINLFLGLFRPDKAEVAIWVLPSDLYLHFHPEPLFAHPPGPRWKVPAYRYAMAYGVRVCDIVGPPGAVEHALAVAQRAHHLDDPAGLFAAEARQGCVCNGEEKNDKDIRRPVTFVEFDEALSFQFLNCKTDGGKPVASPLRKLVDEKASSEKGAKKADGRSWNGIARFLRMRREGAGERHGAPSDGASEPTANERTLKTREHSAFRLGPMPPAKADSDVYSRYVKISSCVQDAALEQKAGTYRSPADPKFLTCGFDPEPFVNANVSLAAVKNREGFYDNYINNKQFLASFLAFNRNTGPESRPERVYVAEFDVSDCQSLDSSNSLM